MLTTIMNKISETNSSFHVKWNTAGKVQFLFFRSFQLTWTKLSFWQKNWVLGYNFMKF